MTNKAKYQLSKVENNLIYQQYQYYMVPLHVAPYLTLVLELYNIN